ncbi:hypothetical protein [Vibrio ulleungensis]|uniref:DUF3015 domain-containing protein n=1 Tax=Vibrio ulleungensis TaxID=2807619 RepID=A0ABS2HD18_9VIBR|nr:hypothetical protein [Vibrio ulleungensis]MBM7035490.1 hypothetical protein [Vibrio ulleungensis]
MNSTTKTLTAILLSAAISTAAFAGPGHDDEFALESDNTQTISFCAAASLQLPGMTNDTNIFYSALQAITDNAHATDRQAGIVEGVGIGQVGVFVAEGGNVLSNYYQGYCQPMLEKLDEFAKQIDTSFIENEIFVTEDSHHGHHH